MKLHSKFLAGLPIRRKLIVFHNLFFLILVLSLYIALRTPLTQIAARSAQQEAELLAQVFERYPGAVRSVQSDRFTILDDKDAELIITPEMQAWLNNNPGRVWRDRVMIASSAIPTFRLIRFDTTDKSFQVIALNAEQYIQLSRRLRWMLGLALLAWLAITASDALQRRDLLLPLFWPELPEERARNALRQAIHQLRRALGGEAVRSLGAEMIGVNASDLWCDVPAFETALSRGALEEAVALYRGDLLPGFAVAGAAEFEHWLEERRRALRLRAVRAAWALTPLRRSARAPWCKRSMSPSSVLLWPISICLPVRLIRTARSPPARLSGRPTSNSSGRPSSPWNEPVCPS